MPIVQRGTVTAQPGRAYASQPLRVVLCQCGCERSQALDDISAELGLSSRPVSSLPRRRPPTRRSSLSSEHPCFAAAVGLKLFLGLVVDGRLHGHDGVGAAGESTSDLPEHARSLAHGCRLPVGQSPGATKESDVWPLGAQGRKGDKRCSRPYKRSQFQRPTRS
jgi:hypothetical protein